MTEPADLFRRMMAEGRKMAESATPALAGFRAPEADRAMPTMPQEFMEAVWGNTFDADGLDAKTRLLVVLAGLVVAGAQGEAQIRLTVRHAWEAGASQREIAEVIWQSGMIGGLPAMNRALELAQGAFDDAGGETRA